MLVVGQLGCSVRLHAFLSDYFGTKHIYDFDSVIDMLIYCRLNFVDIVKFMNNSKASLELADYINLNLA